MLSLDTINDIQVRRNAEFVAWVSDIVAYMGQMQLEPKVDLYSTRNPDFIGPTVALLSIPSVGPKPAYLSYFLTTSDFWSNPKNAATQLVSTLKQYNGKS